MRAILRIVRGWVAAVRGRRPAPPSTLLRSERFGNVTVREIDPRDKGRRRREPEPSWFDKREHVRTFERPWR